MTERAQRWVIVEGVGGTGSVIAEGLARSLKAEPQPLRVILVDRERVEPKDVARKGYWARHLGWLKVYAVVAQIRETKGPEVAGIYIPLAGDIRNFPGIIRKGEASFNCLDNRLDAAMASELSRYSWEWRVTQESKEGVALHSVEEAPPGAAIADFYSPDDFALGDLHVDCLEGSERINTAAGVPQPVVPVAPAIALQLWHDRFTSGNGDLRHRLFRFEAGRLYSSQGPELGACREPQRQTLDLPPQASLGDCIAAVDAALGPEASGAPIELESPVEVAVCEAGHAYGGFVKFPESRCACGSRRIVIWRTKNLREVHSSLVKRPLAAINCPVGLMMTAFAGEAEIVYQLPFDLGTLEALSAAGHGRENHDGV